MNYWEVLELPIQAFWMMNSNIGRILAEYDMRSLSIGAVLNDKDAFIEKRNSLIEEMGDMFKVQSNPLDEKRDEQGFQELKALAALM